MIDGPSSYIPTLDEFLAHWAAVNLDPLAGSGLILREGKTRANLATLRTALAAAGAAVLDQLNSKEIGRAQLENKKRAVLGRAQELGRRLRGILAQNSPYLKAMPDLPSQSASQEVFMLAINDLENLWSRVNAEGTPVVLAAGYTFVSYEQDVGELGTLFRDLGTAVLDLKITREKRNKLQADARTLLSGYRPAVEGLFAPDSPLVLTIPLIYPPAGRTPQAVTATATYAPATQDAVVKFSESIDPDLKEYEIRGVPGPEYNAEDEQVLGKIPKGALREYRTDFSLGQPGTSASFKVFVVLTTGNEKGSTAVTVTRP